jgi:hypothetical protein
MRAGYRSSRGLGALIAAPSFAALVLLAPSGASAEHLSGARQSGDVRQTANVHYTTTEPGAPTGFDWKMEFRDPANPDGKPYSVATIAVQEAPGFALDPLAVPVCHATDAELYAQGAAACPPETRVGGGDLVSDTGSAGGIPRFVESHIENFNGGDHVIGVADSSGAPPVPGFTRIVSRSSVSGDPITFSFDLPAVPGNPPPDPYTALRSLHLHDGPVGFGGRALGRTPPTCPADGHWTLTATFLYRDGVTQSVESRSPCEPSSAGDSDDRRPRIRIRNLPRAGCTSDAFTVAVRIRDASALERAVLLLDGRRIEAARRKRFGARVAAGALDAGSHRLTVRARDAAGNRARRSVGFARCAR